MVRRLRWLGLVALAAFLFVSFDPHDARAVGVTIVVNTTTDGSHDCQTFGTGVCSLRDAITFANNNSGQDTIAFDIAGNGPFLIQPTHPLPPLLDGAGTVIDGYTQLASAPNVLDVGTSALIQIHIHGSSAGVTPGLQLLSDNNTVRGVAVTGFAAEGVVVNSSLNTLAGNFIGVDPAGIASPNLGGIHVEAGSAFTMIGGNTPAGTNVISANTQNGITIEGVGSAGTLVLRNLVGTERTGTGVRANGGWGLQIIDASDITVARNTFAYNLNGGVAVQGAVAARNVISDNQFFQNGGLGIDLGQTGVTSNDPADADGGPNFMQNSPVLTTAYRSASGNQLFVTGLVDGSPLSGSVAIEFYRADVANTGPGEGRFLLHRVVTAGFANFNFTAGPFEPAVAELTGNYLTALATSNDGTSEFSANIPISLNSQPVADAGPSLTASVGALVLLNGTLSSDPDALPKPITYSWTQKSGPPVALSNSQGPLASFVPQQGGKYVFELVINDGLDDSIPASTTVTIGDSHPPVAVPQTVSTKPGTTKTIRLAGTDFEGAELTFKLVDAPVFGTLQGFNETTGVAIYTADPGFSGTDSFTFTVSDGVSTSAPATVAIVIDGGLGIVSGSPAGAVHGQAYEYQMAAAGGQAPYTWTANQSLMPPGLHITLGGLIEGTPQAVGKFTFPVTVTDKTGVTNTRTVAIAVKVEGTYPYKAFVIMSSAD